MLPECAIFISSAVLVTLRFKRIASIRVISQPYGLGHDHAQVVSARRVSAELDTAHLVSALMMCACILDRDKAGKESTWDIAVCV